MFVNFKHFTLEKKGQNEFKHKFKSNITAKNCTFIVSCVVCGRYKIFVVARNYLSSFLTLFEEGVVVIHIQVAFIQEYTLSLKG